MTYTLTITEGDVISAQRLHATPKLPLAMFLVAVALVVVSGAYAQGQLSSGAAIGGLIGMFGWLAIWFLVVIPYRARRIYRQQRNLHLSHAFWWDDQMVYFRSEDTEGKMRWSDFTKIKENNNMLLLYHSDSLFNMLPKRCFSNGESLESFKSHLSAIPKG
jgi:hypothetical protein